MKKNFYILTLLSLVLSHCTPNTPATAANPTANLVDQLSIAGNACGPAALLTAFRSGTKDWQAAADLPGDTDAQKLRHIIIQHGGTWSSHITNKYRWSRRGINAADLTDVANELAAPHHLPKVSLHLPHTMPEIHAACARSLRRGLPPVVGLRRYDGIKIIDAHFITILTVPDVLEKNATSFSFTYADPMYGKKYVGLIEATATSPRLTLLYTPVGKAHASSSSVLRLESVIGL